MSTDGHYSRESVGLCRVGRAAPHDGPVISPRNIEEGSGAQAGRDRDRSVSTVSRVASPMAVLVCAVVILVFLIPPFQAPDEQRHYFRAYQLAQGELMSYRPPPGGEQGKSVQELHSQLGGMLPRAIDDLLFASDAVRLRFHTDRRTTPATILAALSIEVSESDKVYFRFPHTLGYPPYIYLPEVAGILVARVFTKRVLLQFYSARLFNAAAAMSLFALAMWAAPGLSRAILAFAAVPMVVFLTATLSLDATVNAAAAAFAVLCLARMEPGGWRRWAAKVVLGAIICAKLAYAPLLLLLALERRASAVKRASAIALSLVPTVVWLAMIRHVTVPIRTDLDLDLKRQLFQLAAHPILAAQMFLDDWIVNGTLILRSVGILGWLDRPLSVWHVTLSVALLLIGLWASKRPGNRPRAAAVTVAMCSILAACLLVQAAMFLVATPVGASRISGVQGRYFVPLLPTLMVLLARGEGSPSLGPKLFVAAFVLSIAMTLIAVAGAYYTL